MADVASEDRNARDEMHSRTICELLRQISERNRISSLLKSENEKLLQKTSEDNNIIQSLEAKAAGLGASFKHAKKMCMDLESQNASLSSQFQDATSRVQTAEQAVSDRDSQITELNSQLKDATARLQMAEQAISDRDSRIVFLTGQLQEAAARNKSMNQVIAKRDASIMVISEKMKHAEARAISSEFELAEMESSVVWQMTMRFHNSIVEHLLPHGTRRRGWYDIGLKGIRILVNGGVGSFSWNAKNYLSTRRRHEIEPRQAEVSASNALELTEGDQLIHHQEVPLEPTYLETQVSLEKGYNMIRFHVPEGCERPCDIPEMISVDNRCLSIAICGMSIRDGSSNLPLNLVTNWHGIEDSNIGEMLWLSNNATIIVCSDTDCNAILSLNAYSFYRPRNLDIYIKNLYDDLKMKRDERKRFTLMKDVEMKAEKDAIRNELKSIIEGLYGTI